MLLSSTQYRNINIIYIYIHLLNLVGPLPVCITLMSSKCWHLLSLITLISLLLAEEQTSPYPVELPFRILSSTMKHLHCDPA